MNVPAGVQRIHLEREDPLALGKTQVWRGWTILSGDGTGTVCTEEGYLGGNLKVTQIGRDEVGGDPTSFLGQMIQAKAADDGWKIAMLWDEVRFDVPMERRLFQFSANTKQEAGKMAEALIERFNQCRVLGGAEAIDWTTRPDWASTELVMGFRAPVQVGHDSVEVRVRGDKPVVLSADVPAGYLLDTMLLLFAADRSLPGKVLITNDKGVPLGDSRQFLIQDQPEMPLWLGAFADALELLPRPPRLGRGVQSATAFAI